MAKQVENVGSTDAKIVFVEPVATSKPAKLPDFVSPFTVPPQTAAISASTKRSLERVPPPAHVCAYKRACLFV